jgi:hypothetical protein
MARSGAPSHGDDSWPLATTAGCPAHPASQWPGPRVPEYDETSVQAYRHNHEVRISAHARGGGIPERTFALHGDVVVLRIDDTTTTSVDPDALAAALTGRRLEAWSPVIMPPGVSFESLLLWLAS